MFATYCTAMVLFLKLCCLVFYVVVLKSVKVNGCGLLLFKISSNPVLRKQNAALACFMKWLNVFVSYCDVP